MSRTVPILLSFYALTNGVKSLLIGQLTYSSLRDFSFKSYSSRKTFRTILALYRTRVFANQQVQLNFDHGSTKTKTDTTGSFFCIADAVPGQTHLEEIILQGGQAVRIIEDLYTRTIHHINTATIIVSDIDDTLLHSHISNRLLKFRTLMFTSVEKRKAVDSMMKLIRELHAKGATPFYLSNSEQNLYPLIFRFLIHNGFPAGPLFLKQMRKMRHVLRKIKFGERDIHKTKMLEQILTLFPDKKYFLLGDNTQNDLPIYLKLATEYPKNIRYLIIRKVRGSSHDDFYLKETTATLKGLGIGFYYDETFPSTFDL